MDKKKLDKKKMFVKEFVRMTGAVIYLLLAFGLLCSAFWLYAFSLALKLRFLEVMVATCVISGMMFSALYFDFWR